ncbi:hypothetical protein QU755_20145, partial [Pseudomonas wenzhouensis]
LEIGKPLYGGIQSLRWFLVPLLPKPRIPVKPRHAEQFIELFSLSVKVTNHEIATSMIGTELMIEPITGDNWRPTDHCFSH